MVIVLYVVPLLLIGSVLLFSKAVFYNRRPQRLGLLLAVLAVPLFALYYNDRPPFTAVSLRQYLSPIAGISHGHIDFMSIVWPAIAIAAIYVVRVLVYQRLSDRWRLRVRLRRVNDRAANFFAGGTAVLLVCSVLDSFYSWGWVGAVILGSVAGLFFLGAVGTFSAVVELMAASARYVGAWLKRRALSVTYAVVRAVAWIAALSRRLVPNLEAAVERVDAGTSALTAETERVQETQDDRLEEQYARDYERD
jgi:hypothetical protein